MTRMIKKSLTLVLVISICFSISACGTGNSSQSEQSNQIETGTIMNETESAMDETLATDAAEESVSSTDNTEIFKENLKENVEEKIEPNIEVPSKELKNKEETAMQINVRANGNTIVFELNDSQAAKDLYKQLPLSVQVENFSKNEKIFYPSASLDVSNTPLASGGGAGVIAYYAPWGDVVMYYGNFGSASGLYQLGRIVSGSEYIKDMSGTISLTK